VRLRLGPLVSVTLFHARRGSFSKTTGGLRGSGVGRGNPRRSIRGHTLEQTLCARKQTVVTGRFGVETGHTRIHGAGDPAPRSRDSLSGAQATRDPRNHARNRVTDSASFFRAKKALRLDARRVMRLMQGRVPIGAAGMSREVPVAGLHKAHPRYQRHFQHFRKTRSRRSFGMVSLAC
jgi:hypothetical protein